MTTNLQQSLRRAARLGFSELLWINRPTPCTGCRISQIGLRWQHTASGEGSYPRLVQPSTWYSIIPRGLFGKFRSKSTGESKKASNPASYFIWIYLLIGSQAIRIIGVQNEFQTFSRKADVKINKLREVIEKIQKGESVDVEKALGTGDEIQELEWEEALRELENEERVWQNNKKRKREIEESKVSDDENATQMNMAAENVLKTDGQQAGAQTSVPSPPGFY